MASSQTLGLDQLAAGIVDEPSKNVRLPDPTICVLRSLVRLLAQQAARETMREQASSSLPSAADAGP
jgi:hypothetical protein